jgi:hypothetical protein
LISPGAERERERDAAAGKRPKQMSIILLLSERNKEREWVLWWVGLTNQIGGDSCRRKSIADR